MAHNVGILGLGTVGSRFVDQFGSHDAFELTAAWDPDVAACDAHRNAVEIARGADDVIAAADVVYIAVPPLAHRQYVERCVASGTAIFCEKPLGIDVVESRGLVDMVEGSGLAAGVNFVFGAAPATAELQRFASADAGRVVGADLRLHFAEWPRPWQARATWLRSRAEGGWLREVASHYVFLAARLLGPLTIGQAIVSYPHSAVDDEREDDAGCEIHASARLDSERAPFTLHGTSGGVGPDVVEFTLYGTDRSARLTDWYRLETSDGGPWTSADDADRSVLAERAYAAQLTHLAALLDGEDNSIATFREALRVQEIVEAMLH